MTVRIYRSTDTSAPVLTGQVGKLTDLLDAVLVNGYGAQTAAGWTIGQTTTNKRQYTMAAGGTGNSFFVDDTGPGAGGAREARFSGFATCTSTTPTGTGQFPTNAQSSIGWGALVIRKSTTADATARAWTCIADGHTIYFFAETGDVTNPVATYAFGFGDFFSYSGTDTSNCMIIGRNTENTQAGSIAGAPVEVLNVIAQPNTTSLSNTIVGHYCASNFTNVGGSLAFGKHSDQYKMGTDLAGTLVSGWLGEWRNGASLLWLNNFAYPNPTDNGIYVAPFFIHHQGIVRGYLKGFWCVLQHMPLNHNDTFTGTNNLSGKSFVIQVEVSGTSAGGTGFAANSQVCIETSDTWA